MLSEETKIQAAGCFVSYTNLYINIESNTSEILTSLVTGGKNSLKATADQCEEWQ